MVLTIFSPIVVAFLGAVVPPGQIGRIQKLIWEAVGFTQESADHMTRYQDTMSDIRRKARVSRMAAYRESMGYAPASSRKQNESDTANPSI